MWVKLENEEQKREIWEGKRNLKSRKKRNCRELNIEKKGKLGGD